MKSISEIEDQNAVLPTRTKEVTHNQKRSEKGGNDILNKTYIRGKDAKKTRLKATQVGSRKYHKTSLKGMRAIKAEET